MKFLLAIILSVFSISAFAQEETLIKLLAEKPKQAVIKIVPSIEDSHCYGKCISLPIPLSSNETACLPINIEAEIPHLLVQANVKSSLVVETYSVAVVLIDGFSFHVADYYDGTRVVTCLNGPLMGLQAVSVHGVKMAESTMVDWYPDYCIHSYATGKIYSYSNRQIIEIY